MAPSATVNNNSSSLQIPDASPGPSKQHGTSRPVSATVQPSNSPSQPPTRKRASHAVVSSQQQQQQIEDQSSFQDVYSHPAAVAYAAAHPRRTIPKFGPYLLLQTLGEGEFGKVKLGLHNQWGEEVAVKLIRRGNIDTTVRMSKVEREIEVLRTLKHPNIVRLYDVIETDKYIGIILEYASGGELFDHILAHRYLKEKDAAKLFSQLISGVWYIHQKKIVHRDLKLENLLLDRHRNVIITDFGFANRFEHRADDLMQTSCGSPCYAAPELVISEGLYVGSAVDIWSCGVILYAMLAGYLPFDDDPANPDGDNINLLYKYIVNTPLSFPEYISGEARDLLSMMLVPNPSGRADLLSVMNHPWLATYAHTFLRTVDELEQAAMEQHQLKRLAYQKQMKQAAAATEPHSMNRSQSAQPDVFSSSSVPNASGPSRSRAQNHSSPQADYLYETSMDVSIQTPPAAAQSSSRRAASTTAGPLPASSLDDDPFGPSSSRSPPEVAVPETEPRARRSSQTDMPTRSGSTRKPVGTAPVKTSPQPDGSGKKKAGGFRHTIQVEYDDPDTMEHNLKGSVQSPGKQPQQPLALPSRAVDEVGRRDEGRDRSSRVRERRPSDGSVTKPLPVAPSVPSTPSRSTKSPQTSHTQSPSTKLPTPTVSVNASSPPSSPQASGGDQYGVIQKMQSGGSTGSTSSKQSGHRKGLSVDKLGLGKIFGVGSNNSSSAVPNADETSSSDGLPTSRGGRRPSTMQAILSNNADPNTNSKSVAPSAGDGANAAGEVDGASNNGGKKSRRNTLTVMVGPFKNRSRGRVATDAPVKQKKPLPQSAILPSVEPKSALPPPAARFDNASRTDIGTGSDMAASSSKARKVMQWFRTKSKGGPVDLVDEPEPTGENTEVGSEAEKRGATPTQAVYDATAQAAAAASSSTVNQPPKVYITQTPGHPKRSASTATSHSSSQPSLATRIRNSVGVIAAPSAPKGVLRVHHGAVDQTMITMRPPPEVMKHVKEVLERMGMEIQLESEFKYRCVRAKRKKGAVAGGSPTAGLTAVTLVGSAASNGVDKRGLPVASNPGFTGGMLKSILMRRQSSQVSSSGASSQPSPFDDELSSPLTPNPANGPFGAGLAEAVYGDPSLDAGDEVRFSVELTRMDRLKDTFSLDIRRLKGNLRSYKFLYDTLRERVDLQHQA